MVVVVSLLCLFAVYYFAYLAVPPSVYFVESRSPILKKALANGSKLKRVLSQKFWPTPYLFNGHLQTLFNALGWHVKPVVEFTREVFEVKAVDPKLYDGLVSLDWAEPNPNVAAYSSSTPIAIILHGLTGGSQEAYVRRLVLKLRDECAMRVVVFNQRACAGNKVVTPQAYCGSATEDVRQAIASIRSRFPNAPLVAAGYSLGSNVLVNYVGEEGDRCPLSAAVSIANPFDLLAGSRALMPFFPRMVYSRSLAGNLKRLLLQHEDQFRQDPRIDFDFCLQSRTVREFDDRMTKNSFNYDTVDYYYREASSIRVLTRIARPMMCLNALDDPISSAISLPVDECRVNPHLLLVTTQTGGHSMDWFTGFFYPSTWSAGVVASFLHEIVENTANFEPQAAEAPGTPAAAS